MPKHNVIIIGAGPAGISSALYTQRAGIPTTVISKDAGTLMKAHKINNYYGFVEPIDGEVLASNGMEQAKAIGVEFVDGEVVDISYNGHYIISTASDAMQADGVVIAMGASKKSPNIDGLLRLEGSGVSYCAVCDAFFYRGKNVCVIGSSEYAKHEATELMPLANSVTVLANGEDINADFECDVISDKIHSIEGKDKVEKVLFENGKSIDTDGVFVAVGSAGSTEIARKMGIAVENGYIVTDENKSCGYPGLYAAGDCTGGLLQIAKAVYDGALAGTQLIKYIRSLGKE